MISVGNNKAVICKGDFHPAQFYKGDKKIAGYNVEEFEGENGVTLENCYNDKLHNAQIFGNSIQDGTPTPENPVEVQSVGELVTEGEYAGKYKIPVTARGKNLFSETIYPLVAKGWINGTNGAVNGSNPDLYSYTGYISCDSFLGKTITLSPTAGANVGFAFYNAEKIFISGKRYLGNSSCTVVVPEDAVYMRFTVPMANKDIFQLEYGNEPTPYEPYIEPQTFNIYLDEPLRKVGDYADYVDFEKFKVIRRIGKRYLKMYAWLKAKAEHDNHLLFLATDDSILPTQTVPDAKYRYGYSNYFKCINSYQNNLARDAILMHNWAQNIYLTILKEHFEEPTLESFKAWVEENNPYMIRILTTPIEEPIELPELPTFKGTTIYEIDTEIPATISGKYKKVEV